MFVLFSFFQIDSFLGYFTLLEVSNVIDSIFFDFFNKGHYNYNIYLSVSKLNMFVGFHKFLNGYYG